MSRLPTIIFTGSLGAGKTTIINELMVAAGGRRIAVIENEAGEISVDRELLAGATRVVDVVGGCACCTMRGGLLAALELLCERATEIDAVIVEASGVADPIPIVQAFQESTVRAAFRLTALVGILDARTADETLEIARHGRHADTVVLTKLDLAEPHARRRMVEHLAALAPHASVVDRADAPPRLLRHLRADHPAPDREVVAPEDDRSRGFSIATVGFDGDVDREVLNAWLSDLVLTERQILRVKGIAALADSPHRYIVQAVGASIESSEGAPWGKSLRRTRLVFIGYVLDRDQIQRGLEACRTGVEREPGARRAARRHPSGVSQVAP